MVWEQKDKELNLLFLYTGTRSDLFTLSLASSPMPQGRLAPSGVVTPVENSKHPDATMHANIKAAIEQLRGVVSVTDGMSYDATDYDAYHLK